MKLRASAVLAFSVNALIAAALVMGYNHWDNAGTSRLDSILRDPASIEAIDSKITGTLNALGYYPHLASDADRKKLKDFVGFEYLETDSMTALGNSSAIMHTIIPPIQARMLRYTDDSAEAKKFRDQVGDLAVKLLNLSPTLHSQMLPEGISTIANTSEREKAIQHFTGGLARREINRAVKSLVSDFLNVMYGEEKVLSLVAKNGSDEELSEFTRVINTLESLTRQYLNAVWNRPDMIRTRYLGRAFLATMLNVALRESKESIAAYRDTSRGRMRTQLEEKLSQAGILAMNYGGHQIAFVENEALEAAKAKIEKSPDSPLPQVLNMVTVKTGDAIEIEVPRKSEIRYQEKMRNGRDLSIYEQFLFQLRERGIGDGAMKYFGTFVVGKAAVSPLQEVTAPWIYTPKDQSSGQKRLLVTGPEQYFSTKDIQIKSLTSGDDHRKHKYDNGRRIHTDGGLTPVEKMLSKFSLPRPVQSQKIADAISPFLAEGMLRQVDKDVAGLGFVYANAYAALKVSVLGGNFSYIPFHEPNLGKQTNSFQFGWDIGQRSLQNMREQTPQQAEYDRMLQSWGFEDWTKEMLANLQKPTCEENPADCGAETWVNRIQLQRNLKSYQSVNDARELAALIMSRLKEDLDDKNVQIGVVDFAARMLANKPSHPPVDIPVELKALPYQNAHDFHHREKAIEDYVYEYQFRHIEEHARSMVADIAKLIYGAATIEEIAQGVAKGDPRVAQARNDLKKIYDLSWRLAERTYLDALVWQANFFGQALASLIMIESARMGIPFLKSNLEDRLVAKGLYLEHYFTSIFAQRNEKGEKKTFPITDGTMLLTKNMAAESSAISHGAAAKDEKRGEFYNMMAGVDQIGLTMGLSDYTAPLNPKSMKAGPNSINKVFDWLIQKNELPVFGTRMRKGYSHIDYIYLPKLKVQTPHGEVELVRKEILDAYPTHFADDSGSLQNAGGPRKSSLNQVIDRTWHSRAIVGFRDAVQFRKAFLDEMRFRMLASDVARELDKIHGAPKDADIPVTPLRTWSLKDIKATLSNDDVLEKDKEGLRQEIEKILRTIKSDFASANVVQDSIDIWDHLYEFIYKDNSGTIARRLSVLMDENGFPVDRDIYPKIYKIAFDRDEFRPLKVGAKDSTGQVGVKQRVGMRADVTSEQFNEIHFADWGGIKNAIKSAAKLENDPTERARAERWHQRITEIAHAKQLDMIKKGWIFMWVTERVHVKGFVYCSYYLDVAFKLALGFSPEFERGGYRAHVRQAGVLLTNEYNSAKEKLAKVNVTGKEATDEQIEKAGLTIAEKVAFQSAEALGEIFAAGQLDHVVSPTALLLNKGVPDTNIQDFDFENRDAFERAQFRFKVLMPRDPRIEARLETILPRSEAATNHSATYQPDSITAENTEKLHLVEEAITIPMSQGFKFIDIGEQGRIENSRIAKKRILNLLDVAPEEPEAEEEHLEVRSR